jgi:hypothetical protein
MPHQLDDRFSVVGKPRELGEEAIQWRRLIVLNVLDLRPFLTSVVAGVDAESFSETRGREMAG